MTTQHTPGPWYPDYTPFGKKKSLQVTWGPEDNWGVAQIDGPNKEANLRLIAAAPELLAALQALADIAEEEDQFPIHTEAAREAIAKAINP
jgi:hypothetical protein